MKYKLTYNTAHRLPRKLKKAIKHWYVNRLYSKYHHLVCISYNTPTATRYYRCCLFYKMYDAVREYNDTPENIYNRFGFCTKDMVEEYNKVMSNIKKYTR